MSSPRRINASRANRDITLKFVEAVAAQIFIPFSVGGGIRSIEDATKLRLAGAEKVNVNSAAVKRKELIAEISKAIGAQSTVLSMDVKKTTKTREIPSGYEIVINDGTHTTGMDAIEWAKTGEKLGAGELVVNSIDADGTRYVADTGRSQQQASGELDARPVPVEGGTQNGRVQDGEECTGRKQTHPASHATDRSGGHDRDEA